MGIFKTVENAAIGAGKGAISLVKKGAQALASPLVKELQMQDAADVKNRARGKALNAEYSGPATLPSSRRGTSNGYMVPPKGK